MRLTNCEELRARRQAGSVPVAAARVAATPTPTSMDAAGPSAPRRHRRSGLRSRHARSERRHAARVASQRDALTGGTTAAPAREHSVSGPRFPIGLRGATTAYVASANTDAVVRRACPGRHVATARDPSASAGDELPPATSHGYAEWDFSDVPDPVMFWRFLDATDYWFGYSVTPAFLAPNKPPNKSCVFSKLSSRAQLPPSNPSRCPSLSPRRAYRESRRHCPHPGQHPRMPSQRRGRPPCRESCARRGPDGRSASPSPSSRKSRRCPENRKIPQKTLPLFS
jgi:hypothetical protein